MRVPADDQNPQTKKDFAAGSHYMEAAMRLTPESQYVQGRDSFFRGRVLPFSERYGQAAGLLRPSVRIDPGEAYRHNALRIPCLEQADFAKSAPVFRDAARRAPRWPCPLLNLALACIEEGDDENAVRSCRQGMKFTPQFSCPPYRLGLVCQRINRRREAEHRKAVALAPALPCR